MLRQCIFCHSKHLISNKQYPSDFLQFPLSNHEANVYVTSLPPSTNHLSHPIHGPKHKRHNLPDIHNDKKHNSTKNIHSTEKTKVTFSSVTRKKQLFLNYHFFFNRLSDDKSKRRTFWWFFLKVKSVLKKLIQKWINRELD